MRENGKTINDKNLNYEIETVFKRLGSLELNILSMTRISIMRLKPSRQSFRLRSASSPINDKNLNYEIETQC